MTAPAEKPILLNYFQLSSKRYLSFAEYGDPNGAPVLFFHGFPGSRLDGALWHDAAIKHQVRLIVPDRPGIGFSSFQQNRRIIDWPRDVEELLLYLGIENCRLLGTVGGCAYVLGCLQDARLRSKVTAAAVVSGVYPMHLGNEDMPLMPRVMIFLAVWATGLLAVLIDLMLGRAARNKDRGVFERAFMRDVGMRPEVDRVALEQDLVFKEGFLESVRESLRASSYAFVWEARVLGEGWRFDLEKVEGERLAVWHGKWDVGNPVSMARRAGEKMRDARVRVLDEGHLSLMVRHREEILGELVEQMSS